MEEIKTTPTKSKKTKILRILGSVACGVSLAGAGTAISYLFWPSNNWDKTPSSTTTVSFGDTINLDTTTSCTDSLISNQTNIQLHGIINNRSANDFPTFELDQNGIWLQSQGLLSTYMDPNALTTPLYSLHLLRDYDNRDVSHNKFNVTLHCGEASATKTVNINGWTEWGDPGTTYTIHSPSTGDTELKMQNDYVTITIDILNPITWETPPYTIKDDDGLDFSSQFTPVRNTDTSWMFYLVSSDPADYYANFQFNNNGLFSNIIRIHKISAII